MASDQRRTRLAIVGASVRAAAQSALRAGFDVVGADLFADADLDGVCPVTKVENYPDGLADWLAQQDVDAWMYTGALENYPGLVDRMARIAPLWGVSGEPLRRCRDPLVLQEVFREAGVGFPETRRLQEVERGVSGWLAKSYRHSAGAGVMALDRPASWERAEREVFYAQRRLSGESFAAVFAVGAHGGVPLGVTTQLVGVPGSPWTYSGSVSRGWRLPLVQLIAIGTVLSNGLGLVGLVGVDLILRGERLTVIEVNPRWTASTEALESCSLRSAALAHAAACRGESVAPWIGPHHHDAAKQIVYTDTGVEITEGFTNWALGQGHADVPRPGTRIDPRQPLCTVLAQGSDEAQAIAELERRVAEVRERLTASLL